MPVSQDNSSLSCCLKQNYISTTVPKKQCHVIYTLVILSIECTVVTILNELIEFGTEVLSLEQKYVSTVHKVLELGL